MSSIRVLCVDDSALVRQVLKAKLNEQEGIEVVGVAPDPFVARDLIIDLNPDVMTLDIEMPRMDGVEFLRKLMPQFPVPTIVFSSLAHDGGDITLNALDAAAFDYITKPAAGLTNRLPEMIADLTKKIRLASTANRDLLKNRAITNAKALTKTKKAEKTTTLNDSTDKVIAIGASTGGTEALKDILMNLPGNLPGIVIVQHMPPGMTQKFADRLNDLCSMTVKEAKDGDRLLVGSALIAPGGKQMEVIRSGGVYRVKVFEGEKVNNHMPSVEVLFNSIAQYVGNNALGVMLTGMGKDGAVAMKGMRDAGAFNVIQDERSSIVWGMPGEAFHVGAADKCTSLGDIPKEMQSHIKKWGWGSP